MYYGASYCVPGFFLLAGYLISKKEELTIEYCEKKIIKIAIKLLGWIVFWSIIEFIRTGHMLNIWEEYLKGVVSEGILPVAWFLFTYELLILFSLPLYGWLKLKYGKYLLWIMDIVFL